MKGALLAMGLMLAALLVAVGMKGELSAALKSSGQAGLKLLPLLVVAILMMGCIEVLLPKHLVEKWLSDEAGLKGLGIAWLAGILTPAGSLLGLPIVAGLYKAGVSAAVLITYLVSLATLSLVRIPIEVGILGARLTALRIAASLVLPPLAGLSVWGLQRLFPPFPPPPGT